MINIKEMTLKEKLGQLIVAGFDGYEMNDHIKKLISEYKVANVILFARNIKDGPQLFNLTNELHQEIIKNTKTIPLIAIDQEGGMVTRIMNGATFAPGAMTISATSIDNAKEIGHIMGREMISYGINMNLAPSLDVNNNPKNPVIGVRSYSDDPKKVAKFGIEYIKALEEEGVLATAKHFPGHGDTSVDSHLSLPIINHDKERLERIELYPFKEAIKNNVSAIMSAHVFFRAYEDNSLPGTLSYNVLTNLLRNELGYKGLIISDCMEMKAIDEIYKTENGAMMGIKAGLDLVCISHTLEKQIKALEKIEDAIIKGEINISIIDDKVQRILEYKEKTRSFLNKMFYGKTYEDIKDLVSNQVSQNKAYEIVKESYTLYRGNIINPCKKILVIASSPFATTIAEDKLDTRDIIHEIEKNVKEIDTLKIGINPSEDEMEKVINQAKLYEEVLICTYNALSFTNQALLVKKLCKAMKNVYVVSMRSPYDIYAFDGVRNYSILYEYTPNSVKVICDLLKGKVEANGKLPIDLKMKPKIGASIYVGLDQYPLKKNLDYLDLLKKADIEMIFISCHMPEAKETVYEELKIVTNKALELNMKIILDVSKKVMNKFTIPNDIYSLRLDYGFTNDEIVQMSNTLPYYIELNASTITKENLEILIGKGLNINNTRISHNFYPKPYTGLSIEKMIEKNNEIKKYNLPIMAYIPSQNEKRMPIYEGLPSVESHRKDCLSSILQELNSVGIDEIFFGDSYASFEELNEAVNFNYDIIQIPLIINKNLSENEKELLNRIHYNRIDESVYFKRSSCRKDNIEPLNTIYRKKGDVTIDNSKFLRYSGEVCVLKQDLPEDERVNVVGRIKCSDFLIGLIKPGSRFKFLIVGEE